MINEQETGSASLSMFGAVSEAMVALIERVAPSVVQVQKARHGGGAGVIWRADGGIVTNHHVVAGGGGPIEVLLPDGRRFLAKIVNANRALDLALLEVPATDLPAALVDDSTKLRVGELVFAYGHPWGQPNVVTGGIVSALGTVPIPDSDRPAPQYVRSDVRVAPGNSGGPLLNARGAVVGITAMIFGGDLTVAIPSRVATDWVAGAASRRTVLGVGVRPVEVPIIHPRRGRVGRTNGLLVVAVNPDSPASRAGLQVGDVLLAAGGEPVSDGALLADLLAEQATKGQVPLQILRGDSVRELAVQVAHDPA